LPWPLAFVDIAITRPMARAAVRENERFVTVTGPLDARAKGRGPVDPSPFNLDF
jgi:hypothetical protein